MALVALRARRRKRLGLIGAALGALGLALALALFALRDNIALFLSPSDLDARMARGEIALGAAVRIGAQTYEPLPPFMAALLIYGAIVFLFVRLQRAVERRFA